MIFCSFCWLKTNKQFWRIYICQSRKQTKDGSARSGTDDHGRRRNWWMNQFLNSLDKREDLKLSIELHTDVPHKFSSLIRSEGHLSQSFQSLQKGPSFHLLISLLNCFWYKRLVRCFFDITTKFYYTWSDFPSATLMMKF